MSATQIPTGCPRAAPRASRSWTAPPKLCLLSEPGNYYFDTLAAWADCVFSPRLLEGCPLRPTSNHYRLRESDEVGGVVISTGWLRQQTAGDSSLATDTLAAIRGRGRRIALMDDCDAFESSAGNDLLNLADLVLKPNGVYRDRDLYNFYVGACTPSGQWTDKIDRRPASVEPANLEKFRLAPPCFAGLASHLRKRIRPLYAKSWLRRFAAEIADDYLRARAGVLRVSSPPPLTAGFLGSLTHVQRIAGVRCLRRSQLRVRAGITGVPDIVGGFGMSSRYRLNHGEKQVFALQVQREGLQAAPLAPRAYSRSLQDCKAVVSLVGHREVCFRMAEALASRRVLVCQDLSHVQCSFPFQNRFNVIFCRPDLSDLIDILDDIECHFHRYIPVAEQGYLDWITWSANIVDVIDGLYAPLRLIA